MLDVMTDGWFIRFRETTPLGTTSASPQRRTGRRQRDEGALPGAIKGSHRAPVRGGFDPSPR